MSLRRIFITTLVVTLLFGISACTRSGSSPTPGLASTTGTVAPPTATSEPMAALVNGEGISVAEFEAEAARYRAAQSELGLEVTLEQASQTVLDDLINQTLLAQAAYAAGFKVEEADLQARIASLESQIGGPEKLLAWQIAHGYTPEAFQAALKRSLAAAWMRDQIAASVPETVEQVHVRQILVYREETARDILSQLEAGQDFDALAARYDPITQGDLGWFPRGYLFEPEIEKAVFALEPGQVSGMIASQVGFHILKVLERDPQHRLSPEARLVLQDLALQEWLKKQREQSTILLAP
jgi:peptidyl-prolyl cis-trans isomerase C